MVKKLHKTTKENERIKISDLHFNLLKLFIEYCARGVEVFTNQVFFYFYRKI